MTLAFIIVLSLKCKEGTQEEAIPLIFRWLAVSWHHTLRIISSEEIVWACKVMKINWIVAYLRRYFAQKKWGYRFPMACGFGLCMGVGVLFGRVIIFSRNETGVVGRASATGKRIINLLYVAVCSSQIIIFYLTEWFVVSHRRRRLTQRWWH